MAGRRGAQVLGVAAVAGAGYYFWTAGGDPKVAKKEFEHDATTAANRIKGNDYSSKEAQKQGEEWAQKAGSKIDQTVDDARKTVRDADTTLTKKASEAQNKMNSFTKDTMSQAEQSGKETRQEAHDAIDKFDKTVTRKTNEAKSGISSWFGFGK